MFESLLAEFWIFFLLSYLILFFGFATISLSMLLCDRMAYTMHTKTRAYYAGALELSVVLLGTIFVCMAFFMGLRWDAVSFFITLAFSAGVYRLWHLARLEKKGFFKA